MLTQRSALAALLLVGLVAPIGASMSPIVHARSVQAIWQSDSRCFDPSMGSANITGTFLPASDYAVVTVSLSSSDPGDYIVVQLGDFPFDSARVQSGEQRAFVAGHLRRQVMPTLRLLADPLHDYGRRSLTYAVRVLPVLATSTATQGIATSRTPNYAVFQVPRSATYMVRYVLGSGSAKIEVMSATVTKVSRRLTGNGGFTVRLRSGLVVLKLMQAPAGGPMPWQFGLSAAPPANM